MASTATGVLAADAPETPVPGLRILIAEDFEPARRLLQRMLERHHVHADEAVDGRDAVAKLSRGIYDLLLLDLSMPFLDGVQVARWIRDNVAPGSAPRIVVISASAFEEAPQLEQLGVYRLLPKPLHRRDLDTLLSDIRAHQDTR